MYTEAASDSIRLIANETNEFNGLKGIVQVQLGGSGNWSFINGSDWDLPDAIVACRNLGGSHCLVYYNTSL